MLEEYKDIIQKLSDGINPFTGEIFNHEHVCQNANVARALMASLTALEKEILKQKRKKPLPNNAGKKWSNDEDKKLINLFNESVPLKDISAELERTLGSVRSRLLNHGVLTNDES